MAWPRNFNLAVPPVASEGDGSLARLLLRRTRIVLWMCLGAGVAFTLLELVPTPRIAAPFFVKLCGNTMIISALVALRHRWFVAHARPTAIVVIAAAYVMTALSGIVSPSHEYETTAVLFVAGAFVTATALPWGLGPQCLTVSIGAVILLTSVLLADGNLDVMLDDPGAAVAISFFFSLVTAFELERYRRALLRELDARRQAEIEITTLNAELEQRVVERTAQLATTNERLEAEIVERRKAAEALRASQVRLFDIVDHSTAVISLKDRNGLYLLVNREFERLFQLPRSQVIGCTDDQLFPASVAHILRAGDDRVLSVNVPQSREEELPLQTVSRSFLSLKFPLHDSYGAVYGVGAIFTDVTALKELEEKARQHREELAHVLRLHSMGEMAAALAHEIHQPLGAIANFAQGLLRRVRSRTVAPEQMLDPLQSIAEQALRAGEIIRGIRHLVSREGDGGALIDVNDLVTEAARVLEPQARLHGVHVQLDLTRPLPLVEGEGIQIEQVVVNLMLNGFEAIGDACSVRRQLSVTTRTIDDEVEVAVTDTGTGISPLVADKLFKPFFTTKSRGLGMGLSISRSIVDAHGGRLWVVPVPGEGATFCFRLPVADASRLRRLHAAAG
jgi:PAS domain S-box-containing protein